jgi:hypothetical protein
MMALLVLLGFLLLFGAAVLAMLSLFSKSDKNNFSGITTLGFSRCGEAIYPVSSSELQRVSIATQKVTELNCHLSGTTRSKPEALTNGDTESESGVSEAGSKKGTSQR